MWSEGMELGGGGGRVGGRVELGCGYVDVWLLAVQARIQVQAKKQ